jgi:hypothetical protein
VRNGSRDVKLRQSHRYSRPGNHSCCRVLRRLNSVSPLLPHISPSFLTFLSQTCQILSVRAYPSLWSRRDARWIQCRQLKQLLFAYSLCILVCKNTFVLHSRADIARKLARVQVHSHLPQTLFNISLSHLDINVRHRHRAKHCRTRRGFCPINPSTAYDLLHPSKRPMPRRVALGG